MSIQIDISYGELVDKLTILTIKLARIQDPQQLAHVRAEHTRLSAQWAAHPAAKINIDSQQAALQATNEKLWTIEDALRAKERAQTFDEEFITLARSVYITNDRRARIKRHINELLGSDILEEKSYEPY